MAYITNYEYYTNSGTAPTDLNWGGYQYVSLADIINNFILIYIGNDKLINNVERHNVLFHAKRGIQELNYDAFKNVKVLELTIGPASQLTVPPDFVDYVRISYESNGILFPMVENVQVNYATTYLQDNNYDIVFDLDGNVIETNSQLDAARAAGYTQEIYLGEGIYHGYPGWCINGDWYFTMQIGGRFGLDPTTANFNTAFRIDKAAGVFYFSSDLVGQNVVLEYFSDGLENGDDTLVFVPKMAEEAIYAYTNYQIMKQKLGIPMYEKNAAQKAYTAARRNAKVRLSNLKPSRLLMALRGQEKWIK
jgi:hypothetical protein